MNMLFWKKTAVSRFAARLKRFIHTYERQDPPAPKPRRFEIPLAHVWEVRMLADLYARARSGDNYSLYYLLRGTVVRILPEVKGLPLKLYFPDAVRVEVVEILNP